MELELDMVSKTLDMLGKHTTSELNPSPPPFIFWKKVLSKLSLI